VHRERGIVKSRRRREAAGKVTRQRRHELVLNATQRNVEASAQREEASRSPWASQVVQTSHYFPLRKSKNFNGHDEGFVIDRTASLISDITTRSRAIGSATDNQWIHRPYRKPSSNGPASADCA
jgi:hypothetical protein